MLLSELNLETVISDHYPEFSGVHPACVAVPQCSEDEFARLVESIKTTGLHEPILRTKEKLLLDGRTRLLACYVAGQDIRVDTDSGVIDPWVVSKTKNIDRRHLSVGQISYFGDAWMDHEKAEAKSRQGTRTDLSELVGNVSNKLGGRRPASPARDKAGERVGVSGKSLEKMAFIKRYAPKEAEQVKSGEMTLESAYKEAKKNEKATKSRPVESQPEKTNCATTTIFTAKGVKTQIALPKHVVFNQTNDSVDWANWTWNPVTGCEHGCKFCYAREIAHSPRMAAFYPNQFEPTFHEYRLAAPKNTKRPASKDARDGRVFVCSMADLFGKWVPDDWIESVFDACMESPEWEYLFLTKWPARYAQMPLLEGAWYGASVIQQSDVSRVEKAMSQFKCGNATRWISLEPMLEPITFKDISWCDLVVIGSQTSTTQPDGFVPAIAPDFEWVVDVVNHCRAAGVPYYLKANLGLDQPGMKLPKSLPRNAK